MSDWILDPGWLLFSEDDNYEEAVAFAENIRSLSLHAELGLGQRSYLWLMESYSGNWPGSSLRFAVPELTQVVQNLLPQVLSRIIRADEYEYIGTSSPDFKGPESLRTELLSDAVQFARSRGIGVVSLAGHWSEPAESIKFADSKSETCLEAVYELDELARAKVRQQALSFLSGHRLRIVGDKFSLDVARQIKAVCGMTIDSSDWIASERKKVPRDLGKRWGSLSESSDIAICVTGRVGHETSSIAQKCGRALGAKYLEVEYPSDIPQALLDLGLKLSSTECERL